MLGQPTMAIWSTTAPLSISQALPSGFCSLRVDPGFLNRYGDFLTLFCRLKSILLQNVPYASNLLRPLINNFPS